MVKSDIIDSSERGIWKLTDKGYKSNLSDQDVYLLFRKIQDTFERKRDVEAEINIEEILLEVLKNLSPEGFEKICKRLLTEVGLQDVQITGRSGDQGIDGTGVIKVNDVVGFNVIFQCKRYKDAVVPHHVRDFRGTMQGRADKGMIITTGRFTAESHREAIRDGVPPIELIDGERLVSLFEKYQLGLKPKVVYDVLPDFFDNYK